VTGPDIALHLLSILVAVAISVPGICLCIWYCHKRSLGVFDIILSTSMLVFALIGVYAVFWRMLRGVD
jgi:hypothetical protein